MTESGAVNMKHILIVDDDVSIGNMLEEVLTGEGYGVARAYSGTEAVLLLSTFQPDLILLDLMLPGLTGEEVLPRVEGIPVIVISAKADVADKVELLLSGAVDYVTKPFDVKELLARIAVALRKGAAHFSASLSCGSICMRTDTHEVSVAGQEIRLTRTEFAILKLLLQNPSQVITKTLLLDRISADTPDCTDSSLKVHISHLRKKLRDACGRDCIEAVWGIGFRLKAE